MRRHTPRLLLNWKISRACIKYRLGTNVVSEFSFMNYSSSTKTTHFGFSTVEKDAKADMVADVFHSVADQYVEMKYDAEDKLAD